MPLLPRLLHRLAIITGQVAIGDPVVIQPGLYLLHGQVVIDGLTEIGPRARIAPFVTIGLRQGDSSGRGSAPTSQIGTGAKVLGRVTVGDGAADRRERGRDRRRRAGRDRGRRSRRPRSRVDPC